jgi:hypothetical protein
MSDTAGLDPWTPVHHEDAPPEPSLNPTPQRTRAPRQPPQAGMQIPVGLTMTLPPEVMEAINDLAESNRDLAERVEALTERVEALTGMMEMLIKGPAGGDKK